MLYQLYVTRISKRLHDIIALDPVYINIIKLVVNAEIAKTQPRTGCLCSVAMLWESNSLPRTSWPSKGPGNEVGWNSVWQYLAWN
jgi:hypothetical protein